MPKHERNLWKIVIFPSHCTMMARKVDEDEVERSERIDFSANIRLNAFAVFFIDREMEEEKWMIRLLRKIDGDSLELFALSSSLANGFYWDFLE